MGTVLRVAWDVAVIGAGYVGLPLAVRFAETGTRVVCVDPDADKVAQLCAGTSYIGDVPSEDLAPLVRDGRLGATTDFDAVRDVDAIIICVPTPLTQNREPDTSYIRSAATSIAERLRPGQAVVLESTTYPGTTSGLLRPILEASGLQAGTDFHLAMSPERIDPGRTDFTIRNTPKVVGGITPACTEHVMNVYRACCDELVPVSSPDAAELTKLLENIFRSVNIAFINEMAIMCDRMGIDVWEVVAAASTKPFGFMRFLPGPGLGGHCLPLDPFYLAWRAREFDYYTEFIELAGKVNENMPYFSAAKIARALNGVQRSVRGSRVLVLGLAYKADIDDVRESPAEKIIALLEADGAIVSYHDPHVPEHGGLRSVELDDEALTGCDCAVIVTAHRAIDFDRVVERAPLVVDLRNATGDRGGAAAHVHKL
jgi:UDP-N-acetyl-D-glucosamine dehydrogenase